MTDADPDALFEGDEAAAPGDDELAPPEEMGRGGRRRRAAREPRKRGRRRGRRARRRKRQTGADRAPTRPPPAPPAAAAAAQPAAAAESGFHIQVLATSDRDKADALVARLVDADFKAFIVPSNEGGRTMYRVRVGPFSDRADRGGQGPGARVPLGPRQLDLTRGALSTERRGAK